jgi:NADH:ubiquinone reductase (H+-translocating)
MTGTLETTTPQETLQAATESAPMRPCIVIIGGGFAGIAAARPLKRCDAEVVLIDRRNHHIFQPLLYQVATAILAPSDVATPIRQLADEQKNVSVMLAEVTSVDVKSRTVEADGEEIGRRKISFDYLVVAPGMQGNYFGHNEFARYAPSLKNLTDAEEIRTKILRAYEIAEWTDDPAVRKRELTFVLVGGGPTGVELAASIAQLATVTLRSNFRRVDPADTSILIVEGGKRILPSYAESLSAKAVRRLERQGVKVMTGARVEHVDEHGVIVAGNRIESATVLWTAGVTPSPVVKMLGAKSDRAGRPFVGPLLNLPENPRVFVVGDAAAAMQDGRPLPGVAQVAIQQGRYVGRLIAAELKGQKALRPFRYLDKGSMAVVGKNFAIMESGRIRMSGFLAWLAWAVVHIMSLPQLQNRLRVQRQWFWSYFTGQRGARLISEPPRVAQ